jgi:hypothetical protein
MTAMSGHAEPATDPILVSAPNTIGETYGAPHVSFRSRHLACRA